MNHSLNSTSTFQVTQIVLNGDVSMNPGPPKCPVCSKSIARNHRAVECNVCQRRLHFKYGKLKPLEFDRIQAHQLRHGHVLAALIK